jgi:hypothetical protein
MTLDMQKRSTLKYGWAHVCGEGSELIYEYGLQQTLILSWYYTDVVAVLIKSGELNVI